MCDSCYELSSRIEENKPLAIKILSSLGYKVEKQ
jgi:hypothetical protein